MKAVVTHDFNEATVEDVSRPEPGEKEVLVEVDTVQLSVTECFRYRGEEIAGHQKTQEKLAKGSVQQFGHEFAGEIVELGPGVEDFAVGDRVYAPGKISCLDCIYCDTGFEEYCPNKIGVGSDRPGALSAYFTIPTQPLAKLPDEVSYSEGAALQPLASALLCVFDGRITMGDVVTVLGCGVMGYQSAQIANELGASDVYAIDVVEQKLEHAASRGIHPIDATEADPIEFIKSETGGVGSDIVYASVGGTQSQERGNRPFDQAFEMVRKGGTVVQVGHIIGDITITPRKMRSKCVDWVNPTKGTLSLSPNCDTGDLAAELVATDRISISEFITHQLDGLESFDEAVDITLDKAEYDALGPAQIKV